MDNIDLNLISKVLWVGLIVLWGILRWVPNRRSRKTATLKSFRDFRENVAMALSLSGLGIIPFTWVFLGWPEQFNYDVSIIQLIIGVGVFIYSLVLFRKTHKALGKMWSVSLDIRQEHKLIDTGVYAHVRHPMYSAFWLLALSQCFLLGNFVAGFAGLFGFGALFFMRIGPEEKMLEETFGEQYRSYCERSKKVIPYIY